MSIPMFTTRLAGNAAADVARRALPGAPVQPPEPQRSRTRTVRTLAAAALHRLGDAVAPAPVSTLSH